MKRILLSLTAAAALSAGTAFAGEQYIDGTGYAVSGYDVVAYFSLEQAPVGQAQPLAVPGSTEFTTEYNGATWAFSSQENLDLFLADPDRYVPAYDGHCAYGVSLGGKVPGNPHLWRIVDDTLYLNITDVVVGLWEEDIPGHIQSSETNWVGIEPDPAAERVIPNFESSAPQG